MEFPKKDAAFMGTLAMAIMVGTLCSALVIRALDGKTMPFGQYSGLQAVFLTNGQVYFGMIDRQDAQTIHLKGIFYIQKNAQADAKPQNDVALAKLGNELHGPEDWMDINRSQVLFVEQLKADGRVAVAIKEYQSQGK